MKKKEVGLITMHQVVNVGSALQAYATQKVIEKLGYYCTIIDYAYPTDYHLLCSAGYGTRHNTKIAEWYRLVGGATGVLAAIRHLKHLFFDRQWLRLRTAQVQEFASWQKLLKKTQPYRRRQLKRHPPLFDLYVTGSDQVWKAASLCRDFSYLLDFVPDGIPKIAYAASFGGKEILAEYQQEYSELLARYNHISVREYSGVELVRKLTGHSIDQVLDPTLLLKPEEWKPAMERKHSFNKPYIMCYILDGVFDPYPVVFDLVRKVQELTGYDVVFVGSSSKAKELGFHWVPEAGPGTFLHFYDGASFVITNSFHGTAFAVNFHKDFLVLLNPSPGQDDRIIDFLNLMQLESRGVKFEEISQITSERLIMHWDKTIEHLNHMRSHSENWLRNALEIQAEDEKHDCAL